MIKPFVINSNICTSAEDISSYDRFMDAIAGNTGNSYITWALLKELGVSIQSIKNHHIKNIYSYDFSLADRDIDIIEHECTHVVLILQDQIRIQESYGYLLPFKNLQAFLSRIKKPILVAGLGSNSLDGFVPNFHQQLNKDLIDFLHFLSENCQSIGIRGHFTEEVLHNLGIDNVTVIGCPSYYEMGRDRIITKPEWRDDLLIATSSGFDFTIPQAKAVYLQDQQKHEVKIIRSIAFGEKFDFPSYVNEDISFQKYKIFSDIIDWKNSLHNYDFFIGVRVHGAMAALNSGLPVIIMNKDSRSREMAEYLNIPYRPDLFTCKDVRQIFDVCDYGKMNREYNDKLDHFISFLSQNGFNYHPLEQQSQGISLPLYRSQTEKEDLFSKFNCFERISGVKSHRQYGNPQECQNPKVSVIMPVYNRPDMFKESLESVIHQDYQDTYEIVVVDNYDKGPESPNKAVVESVGAKNVMYYRHEQNLGYNGNCNRGIQLARAQYVTFCHDDDLFLPLALTRLMELQKIVGDKCIVSVYKTIDPSGNLVNNLEFPMFRNGPWLIQRDHFRYTLWDQFLSSGGLLIGSLFNRDKLMSIGGYDENYEPVTDYALQACYTHYYGCVMNNVPVFKYRVGANASTYLYTEFANAQNRIQKLIAPKLMLPDFILKPIMKARYNYVSVVSELSFGHPTTNVWERMSKMDSFILKLNGIYRKFREYRFNTDKRLYYETKRIRREETKAREKALEQSTHKI